MDGRVRPTLSVRANPDACRAVVCRHWPGPPPSRLNCMALHTHTHTHTIHTTHTHTYTHTPQRGSIPERAVLQAGRQAGRLLRFCGSAVLR